MDYKKERKTNNTCTHLAKVLIQAHITIERGCNNEQITGEDRETNF